MQYSDNDSVPMLPVDTYFKGLILDSSRSSKVYSCEVHADRQNNPCYARVRTGKGTDHQEALYLSNELGVRVESQRLSPLCVDVRQNGLIRFTCVLRGSIKITAPGGRVYILRTGHCLASRYRDAPVRYEVTQHQTYRSVEIFGSPDALLAHTGLSPAHFPPALRQMFSGHAESVQPVLFPLDDTVLAVLAEAIRCKDDPVYLRQLYLKSRWIELIYHFIQCIEQPIRADMEDLVPMHPSMVNRLNDVRLLLHQRLEDPPAIQELCQLSGYSVKKLLSGFKSLFGDTPYQYSLNKRLEEARRLLELDEYSVTEVAYRVGYQQVSSFSRAFQAHFGKAPTRYSQLSHLS